MVKQKKHQNKQLHLMRSKNIKVDLKEELGLDIKKDNTYIIPIFIPHRGCKNECVFCNQRRISGEIRNFTENDVRNEIEKYLEMYKSDFRKKQIAFFGGSFTGLEINEQIKFLDVANEYINRGLVENIRVSTRPDYISEEILKLLKRKNVKVIELGVQSMDDEVLEASKRGHTAEQVIKASKLIKKFGFVLGHQVMVGLPKSTLEKEIYTIKKCIKLKPELVRIYPVYVLKESQLWDMYKTKEYLPLNLEDAIQRASEMYSLCVKNRVNVIRIGLQTTQEINSKNIELVGPICDNYKERILSYISYKNIKSKLEKVRYKSKINLIVSRKQVNYIVGNNKINLNQLNSEYSGRITVKVKE